MGAYSKLTNGDMYTMYHKLLELLRRHYLTILDMEKMLIVKDSHTWRSLQTIFLRGLFLQRAMNEWGVGSVEVVVILLVEESMIYVQ